MEVPSPSLSFPGCGPFPAKAHVILNHCQRAVRSPAKEHKERLWPRTEQGTEEGRVTAVAVEWPLADF